MVQGKSLSVGPLAAKERRTATCLPCGTRNTRKPSVPVTLSPQKVIVRGTVKTGSHSNPFKRLNRECEASLYLCVTCRHKTYGWQVISNPRRYGAALSRNALTSWKNRCTYAVSGQDARLCFLCVDRGDSGQVNELRGGSRAERPRNPTRDWRLFNISVQDGPVQTLFTADLTRVSGCEIVTAETLISDPCIHFLCYYHLNHSRIAREVPLEKYYIGRQKCVFELRGCSLKGSAARSARLWSMKDVSVEILNDFEYYTNLDERIRSHSYGELSCYEVMNQFYCRSCLYIMTEGRSETRPAVSLTSISSSVDRFLVRCIFYSLESEDEAEKAVLCSIRLLRTWL